MATDENKVPCEHPEGCRSHGTWAAAFGKADEDEIRKPHFLCTTHLEMAIRAASKSDKHLGKHVHIKRIR